MSQQNVYKRLLAIAAEWPAFDAARGDRNLSLHIRHRAKTLFAGDAALSATAAQRELASWKMLANNQFMNKYNVELAPIPRMAIGEKAKLSAASQTKISARVRGRFQVSHLIIVYMNSVFHVHSSHRKLLEKWLATQRNERIDPFTICLARGVCTKHPIV